ncbi:glycosyltransferase family 2 protein [Limnovirga soli]|uniref:glycosyltransferase family 2 protein n=1 Tax=Limnovirga soli TaxID=2656915 RepID=UPI001C0F137E|nr:glycosyltransferase family 2 protein [Limnovirga soli]
MQLSIVIVNYRSANYIIDCLSSAFKFASAQQYEWIIVDNHSQDHSRQLITAQFPMVHWIDMGYNAGFARANNQGIRQAKTSMVLLLNPDTLIIDDAIENCMLRMQQNQECIAAAVQLLNPDGSPQITGNFFMKGGLNHLLPLPYLGAFLRKIAFAANVKKTNVQRAGIAEKADWINGAFLMVKQTAIDKAGLLDEDFFLYAEEIEWCSRLGKYGILMVFGDLFTTHLQGESINSATNSADKGYFNLYDKKGLQLMVSNHVRIRKQFGVGWFLVHLLVFTFEIPLFFVCSFFHHLLRLKNPLSQWQLIKQYTKNVFILWQLSPVIVANTPHFYKMF